VFPAAATDRIERPRSRLVGVLVAAAVVTAITLVLYPLSGLDPGVSSGSLYVLGALLVSISWGLWLGLPTAVGSALALAYFHATPAGSFRIQGSDVAAIGVLLLTCVVASVIADRARRRTEDARQRLALEAQLRHAETERLRLEQVRDSGARVLSAVFEERRRVVRDLHDGAQQRLVHTVITLKLARRELEHDHVATAARLLGEALEHAEQTTVSLRDLSRGILPSTLTRGGLKSGIGQLTSHAPLPITVEVPGERLPAQIEATAYFVVAEALTNVVKHARATSATVSAVIDGRMLHIEVGDDGVGGARTDGHGLSGLVDRVGMLEGRLRIDSPEAGGTRVIADLPLAT
jgi:signal transduction histidine kinase